MIVVCTGCSTKYKVSDDKVGPLGVKVKCPKCKAIFEVHPPREEMGETLGEKLFGKDVVRDLFGPPLAHEKDVESVPDADVAAGEDTGRGWSVPPPLEAALPPAPSEEVPAGEALSEEPPASYSPEPPPTAFPFESRDEDPRSLARALVSDILVYNREARDRGLAEGKILAFLGKEIVRSWETYKERVGIGTALETDYFRQAVNEILGEGKDVL